MAIGSSQGNRTGYIKSAIQRFKQHRAIWRLAVSKVYETEPLGETPQGLYLNAVMRFETNMPPADVLALCLDEEEVCGRERSEDRYAPRTLDLDLLLYGDEIIEEENLIVPHPRMCERGFVLEPLAELGSQVIHPVEKISIEKLAAAVRDPMKVRLSSIHLR